MKSAFILIVLIVSSVTAFGQKIRFTDTTNTWFVVYSAIDNNPTGPPDYYIRYHNYAWGGDTVLHNVKYRKLVGTGQAGPLANCLVREDIPGKKVYGRYLSVAPFDTVERVLYDYNLQLGDTLKQIYSTVQYVSWVVQVDSVLINGVYHKQWHFQGNDIGTVDQYVVEGIGSLSAPWFPLYPYLFENRHTLSCFSSGGNHPLVTPKAAQYFDNANSCTLDVATLYSNKQIVRVVPDPATITAKIVTGVAVAIGEIEVYDVLGRCVLKTELRGIKEIPIGKYLSAPGQYFYRLVDESKYQSYTGSFIYQ